MTQVELILSDPRKADVIQQSDPIRSDEVRRFSIVESAETHDMKTSDFPYSNSYNGYEIKHKKTLTCQLT